MYSPVPVPVPKRSVPRGAAPDLGEEPEKGPEGWDRAAATRLHEEPGASRRPPGVFSDSEFRRLCALVRSELATHAGLEGADLMEHLKCACARRRLAYDSAVLGRVLDVVQPRKRLVQRHAEPCYDTPRPKPAINIWRCCAAEHDRFVCTLPPGHEGDHIATDRDEDSTNIRGTERARWCQTPPQCALRAAKEGR